MEKPTMLEKIGKAINYAGNTVMMNLLFLVACLPIVTIGQAWCGLLTAVRYQIRGDKWTAGFKKGFFFADGRCFAFFIFQRHGPIVAGEFFQGFTAIADLIAEICPDETGIPHDFFSVFFHHDPAGTLIHGVSGEFP